MQRQDGYFLDKARVRAAFHRAAACYDAAAIVQKLVRDEMASRLDLMKIAPDTILDAGCGTGRGSYLLNKRFGSANVVSLDLAVGMLEQTRLTQPLLKRILRSASPALLCADIERLPLMDASVGMVWSNLALQWCNDLDAAFAEFYRVMQPESLLMFSTFGPDTLKELRASSMNGHTHVSRFVDMHDIGDALVRAGFSAPVLDVEHYTLTYDDVKGVMRDLKSIGAHNATEGRARGLMGKGFLHDLTQNYERFRQNGKLPATFEVVFGHAWKPESTSISGQGEAPIQFFKRK
ncbi:MAG TPA: malonyl-ACP O-methyltransferase BioC [Methylophilus sp.]|nr:malonyl-ACP O-methyltransferase BioC [Methylophilus sp.]HQQ32603.1 malonyl-ACP O-methyltransferase BioC [Methylophilus sp.]